MATKTFKTTDITDTFIDDSGPTINNSTNTALYAGEFISATIKTRLWIKPALGDGSVPAGSTINSATLRLKISADFSSNTRTLKAYRVLRAASHLATWNTYDGTNNWGTAGASNTSTDREATDIGSVSIAHDTATGTWVEISLTTASVQEMLASGSFTNNGLLLQMDTETDDCWEFYSTDHGTSANHPELVIDYTAPSSVNGMPVFF